MANSLGNKISLVTLVLILFTGSIVPADSPIADAAMRNDSDAVYNLLQQGEDVNAAQGDGMTALHWAAENGDLTMVEVLLSAGANFNSTTRLGSYAPLHLASKMGHGEVIRTCLLYTSPSPRD